MYKHRQNTDSQRLSPSELNVVKWTIRFKEYTKYHNRVENRNCLFTDQTIPREVAAYRVPGGTSTYHCTRNVQNLSFLRVM